VAVILEELLVMVMVVLMMMKGCLAIDRRHASWRLRKQARNHRQYQRELLVVVLVGKVQLLPVCTLSVSAGMNSAGTRTGVVVAAAGGGAVIMVVVVVAEVVAR
jgi:hypothetical protein